MVGDVKIKLRNNGKLVRKLENLVPGMKANLDLAMKKSAEELEEKIKAFAPERSGQYKESIKARPITEIDSKSKNGSVKFTGVRGWGIFAHYKWSWIEFGTVRTQARPHIFPVYRTLKKRIRSRISRAINKSIKATAKGKASNGK